MRQEGPLRSGFLWDLWNLMTELYWKRFPKRYLLLRYEDLVARPEEALNRILALVGEEGARLPLQGERRVCLKVNHTVAGNPSRFKTGNIELKANEKWRTEMRASHRRIVSVLSWPFLYRYGYLKMS